MTPKRGEWVSYNGGLDGNRYSPLDQITTANVKQLQPQFLFSPGGEGLEGTPLVMDGIMYVTGGPKVCAIDARTGLRIWCTPRTNGLGAGDAESRQSPPGRPAEHDGIGAQRQRLEDIGSAADATVEQDGNPAVHGRDDFRQNLQGRRAVIHRTAAMV